MGLGLTGRFCEPCDVEHASKLERVRDAKVTVKFLQEVLPGRRDFVWITIQELREAEDLYEKRRVSKRGTRKVW